MFKNNRSSITKDFTGGFGKLPIHSEFIKYRVITPPIIALDNWYQQAYAEFNREFNYESKSRLSHMPIYHFLFSAEKPMIGSVYAGYDSGGRYYPFVITRILENPLVRDFMTSIPLLYENYFKAIERFFQQSWKNKNLNDLYNGIENLTELSCDPNKRIALEKVLTTLKTTSLADYWQGISNQNTTTDLNFFFSNLIQILKQKKPFGIRLPLSQKTNLLPYVTFFLQWFESTLTLPEYNWQVYWQQASDSHIANMIFVSQPLESNYWKHFLSQDIPIQNMNDLLKHVPNSHCQLEIIEPNIPLYEAIQQLANK